MKCKKCRKKIPDDSKFCCYCGNPVIKKLYRRPDGLYEKSLTINGKRKVFRGKSEKEVFQKIAQYDTDQANGPLFSELVETWEQKYCSKLAPSTVHGYEAGKNAALDYFKNVYVKDIQTHDIQQFADSLPKSFSKHTISNYIAIISSIFSFGIRSGDFSINYNPCHNARIQNGQEGKERRIATDEEIEIIMANSDKPFGLFPAFLLLSGCRRGEALALTWGDIDFKNDVIRVTKSLTWKNCRPIVKTPKTKKGSRDIILLPELKELLKQKKKTEPVFPNLQGGYMTENQYEKMWTKYCKLSGLSSYGEQSGLTKLTAHCLRHGYATILYEANVDIKEAQRLLGHAKESTTREIYTHITERSKNKSAEKLKVYVNEQFNKKQKSS